jgi:hypothetical protein
MLMYGLASLPLIDELTAHHPSLQQFWYAHDGNAEGSFNELRALLDTVEEKGRPYGYYL